MSDSIQESCPTVVIESHQVETAVKAAKGSEYELVSWKAKEFTKKGDNYASYVTRIIVQICNKTNKTEEETTFIAKIRTNASLHSEAWRKLTKTAFFREGEYLQNIGPQLSDILANANHSPLRIPKCYQGTYIEEKEMLLNEDLTPRNFQMIDRKKGLDADHLKLVLEELARMHAASQIIEKQNEKSAIELFPILGEEIFEQDTTMFRMFEALTIGQMNTSINILKELGSEEYAIEKIQNLQKNCGAIVNDTFNTFRNESKFRVIIHGDCWSNNFLFRYDEEQNPKEVMLLDLQIIQLASLAVDLNRLIYSTLQPTTLKSNLNEYLQHYYKTFIDIFTRSELEIPFTFDELLQEYKDHSDYGIIMGHVMVPIVALESDDVLDLNDMSDEESAAQMVQKKEKRLIQLTLEGGVFQKRFLALIEQMKSDQPK